MFRQLFKKKKLEEIKLFWQQVGLANKAEVELDFEKSNLQKYKDITSSYYFYYLTLQEQSRKAFVQDQQYISTRDQASQTLINRFNEQKDFLSLQFIIEFDLYNEINLDNLANDLQEKKIILNYSNLVPFSSLLDKLIMHTENEELKDILCSKIFQFIKNELEERVYSIPNEEFSNLLKAVYVLSLSNKHFIQLFPSRLGFQYIQEKLNDYEQLEELISPEYMPMILYYVEKISQVTSFKFQINYGMYDTYFKNKYKSLNGDQLFYLSSFFLLHLKQEQIINSRMFEEFYFSLLNKTPYHNKEYLIRKLGIYNFDQPLLQLAKTAATRFFLLNVTQKEPKYRKTVNLLPLQQLELAEAMLNNVQYKNSPLIATILSESLNKITQIYMYDVKLDYAQENQQLHRIYQQVLSVLAVCTNELLHENKDVLNLIKIILNYYSLHHRKFDQMMIFNLIQILGKVVETKNPSENTGKQNNLLSLIIAKKDSQLNVLFKDQSFNLFENILKINLQEYFNERLNEVLLVNQQDKLVSTIQLIESFSSSNCLQVYQSYFQKVTNVLDKLTPENKQFFIDFLSRNSESQLNNVVKILETILSQYGDSRVFSDSYQLKSSFIILFMKFYNRLESKNQQLLEQKINDLINFQISSINENIVLTTVKLIKQSQNAQIRLKVIDNLQDVFFRIISDSHSTYSIQQYQEIITICMNLNNFDINFDDGSECYMQTLPEELRQFNTDNFKKFTPQFQKLIEPYVSIEENILKKYLEEIEEFKEKVKEATQN